MSSRNNLNRSEALTAQQKHVLKEIKRDLIRFVPPMVRRTRKQTREFDTPDKSSTSSDYGKTFDHRNPTIASSKKCQENFRRSISDVKSRMSTSHSTECTGRNKIVSSKEIKEYNPKKLVYPSVRRLKKWMTSSVGEDFSELKNLKKILFDHINKNMKHLNLRVSKEIEVPSVTKSTVNPLPMKLPEIQKLGGEFKRITVNHKKTGIMRRNKLLLEHIMHERIRHQQVYKPTIQHYRTNISMMA